jgi:hypothetical protein
MQKTKGKNPSTQYEGIRNPQKALKKAIEDFAMNNGILPNERGKKEKIRRCIDSLIVSHKEELRKAKIDALFKIHLKPDCSWSRTSSSTQGKKELIFLVGII